LKVEDFRLQIDGTPAAFQSSICNLQSLHPDTFNLYPTPGSVSSNRG